MASPAIYAASERQIHSAAVDYLMVALPQRATFHHSPNEGKRGVQAQRDIRRFGLHAGWPDLEIIFDGMVYFIELKTVKGKLSKAQELCHQQISDAGFEVAICRSLDEVIEQCQQWGLVR